MLAGSHSKSSSVPADTPPLYSGQRGYWTTSPVKQHTLMDSYTLNAVIEQSWLRSKYPCREVGVYIESSAHNTYPL